MMSEWQIQYFSLYEINEILKLDRTLLCRMQELIIYIYFLHAVLVSLNQYNPSEG